MNCNFALSLIFCLVSSSVFSASNQVCTKSPGLLMCENGSVDNITGFYGSANIDNVTVKGAVNGLMGSLSINDSQVNHLAGSIGSLDANNSKFLSTVKANIGSADFNDSSLTELDVHAGVIYFSRSTAEKITMFSSNKRTKIYLTKKSVIKGDIVFPENSGEVCIDKTSQLKGTVVNGKIVRDHCVVLKSVS